MSVIVRNMPWTATEDDLWALFEPCGTVARVHIAMDRDTGKPRGFAFVDFDSAAAASKATALTGKTMGDRELRIELSLPKDSKTPGTGGPRSAGPGGPRAGEERTVFVKGFDRYLDEESIRGNLTSFFEDCGAHVAITAVCLVFAAASVSCFLSLEMMRSAGGAEKRRLCFRSSLIPGGVVRVRIPTDQETGAIKGFGFVEFDTAARARSHPPPPLSFFFHRCCFSFLVSVSVACFRGGRRRVGPLRRAERSFCCAVWLLRRTPRRRLGRRTAWRGRTGAATLWT